MRRGVSLVVGIWIMLVLAGCTYPSGDTIEVRYYGSATSTDGAFRLSGELVLEGGIPNRDGYRDVEVHLANENRTTICRASVGTLRPSGGPLEVSLRSSIRPHFVVFESKDFWAESSVVEYLALDPYDGAYRHREATAVDDLPIPVDGGSVPRCGT